MNPCDWTITEVERGKFVVGWKGESWGMIPRDKAWCMEYVERLVERYPTGGEWLVSLTANPPRSRGGPWRWTWGEESEVIHVGRLSDAKSVLRHSLRRKTLPRGITWNIEEDA